MSNRHDLALASIDETLPFSQLAENLWLASLEVEDSKGDPASDPAIMLIGMQITFATHSDFLTKHSFDKLVAACKLNTEKTWKH